MFGTQQVARKQQVSRLRGTSQAYHQESAPQQAHLGSAIDARLHTADSSGLLYSIISVQRLLHLMVPRFCWLDLRLQVSLYSM